MTLTRSLPLLTEALSAQESPAKEAGFGALETPRGCLPLEALDVVGRIDGLLAQVTVRQTFVNATDEPLEATYIFPLPDRAAVTGFRMEVAGRVVDGVLQERSRARREYAEAVRHGHRASIAEEERPGVFTMRVGNLMAGERATVQLTMAGTLPYSDGDVTFRFPLVVAPRYIPGLPLPGPSVGAGVADDTDAVPDASRITPPVLLPGFPHPVRLSLAIELHETGAAADHVRVSLHAVWEEALAGEGVRRIVLQPGARLDRDFIIRFRLGSGAISSSLSVHPDPDAEGEGTFALSIVPPAASAAEPDARRPRPRDLVFLLDRSGSMAGWKMVAARRAMSRMIETLTDIDRFALLAFDDQVEAPEQGEAELASASDRNRFKAAAFLAEMKARGGTEIAPALELAVGLFRGAGPVAGRAEPARDRILVLVTDGQVGNEDQVMRMIAPHLDVVRVFTLGIDQAVNEGFLRRLSELGTGGGSCELVESENRLDEVMESIHRRIGTPLVSDVQLTPQRDGLDIVADSLVPARPPCLFPGSPLLILGRYHDRGRPRAALVVRGQRADGGQWQELLVPAVRDNPAIAAAWARGRIRELEDQYAAGRGDLHALEQSIIRISLRHGVLCRFTAFVAVDRSAVANEGGEVHQITQPVEMPSGWEMGLVLQASAPAAPMAAGSYLAMRSMACDAVAPMAAPPEELDSFGFAGYRSFDLGAAARLARARRGGPARALPHMSPKQYASAAGYALLGEIGGDASGTVYNAVDKNGKRVSIRLLSSPVDLGDSGAIARLEKKLRRLSHPAILPVLALLVDPSTTKRVVAVVSEAITGAPLDEWLSRVGRPDPRTAAELVLVLAEGLEHAARRGVRHRLNAPLAIRILQSGSPCITDFGLAELGLLLPADEPSNVYALGVILRRLLTGVSQTGEPQPSREEFWKVPCGPAEAQTLDQQVPETLAEICTKAQACAPEPRYASVNELAADLRKFLGVSRWARSRRASGKRK